jgi:hypothetical protein
MLSHAKGKKEKQKTSTMEEAGNRSPISVSLSHIVHLTLFLCVYRGQKASNDRNGWNVENAL